MASYIGARPEGLVLTGDIADDAVTSAKIDSTSTGMALADLTVDTSTLVVDATNNRVNIGTATGVSGYPLRVANNSGNSQVLITAGTNFNSTIAFGDQDANDTGQIIYASNGDSMRLHTNGSERVRIDSSGQVGIGTTSPAKPLDVQGSARFIQDAAATTGTIVLRQNSGDSVGSYIQWVNNDNSAQKGYLQIDTSSNMKFATGSIEAMRITSSQRVAVNNTSPIGPFEVLDVNTSGSSGEDGFAIGTDGRMRSSSDSATQFDMNDTSAGGGTHNYIVFRYHGTAIGDIDTTNNSTIRYNTFTGAHWAQWSDHSQPEIKLGTVISTINEMCRYTQFEYEDTEGDIQKTEISGTFEVGTKHTIYIDEGALQVEGTAIAQSTHKRLAKVKVSDVVGDKTVYGVFAGHYKDGDSSIESLGLGAIRIGSGVTVENGDLLESAGDGTAKPQTGDTADLFKSSTIAKVTSTVVIETYEDGSYTIPCTLHCG